MQSPCNNYEIRGTDFSDPPLFRDWVDYTDCYGVRRRQYVTGVGIPYDPSVVNICSHTTPTAGTDRPIGGARVSITLINPCNYDFPTIPCGQLQNYNGGQSFPNTNIITLGSSVGGSAFRCEAFGVPDKFMLFKYDGPSAGELIYNSGYRGDSSWQSSLDANLISRGLPVEPIVGGGNITYFFTKTSDYTKVKAEVWAPIPDTAWEFSIDCPS